MNHQKLLSKLMSCSVNLCCNYIDDSPGDHNKHIQNSSVQCKNSASAQSGAQALVALWLQHPLHIREVVGSIPGLFILKNKNGRGKPDTQKLAND